MIVSLKKAFLVVVMVLTLVAGLFGWSMKMMTSPLIQHHGASIQRLHYVADGGPNKVSCPPPPFEC